MLLADSHCHLHMLELGCPDTLTSYLAAAKAAGLAYILNVGTSSEDIPKLLAIHSQDPQIHMAIGIHPASDEPNPLLEDLLTWLQYPRVMAIGETGLDYYHTDIDSQRQRARFCTHIHAALLTKKPIIIHTRDAAQDTLEILRSEGQGQVTGVFHCFTGDWAMAKLVLDLGFYISLSGIVTFKNATIVQEVAQHVPLERLLIETDAPYLAPVPMRGKPNQPAYLYHTAQFIAQLRKISLDQLSAVTTNNYLRLFAIGNENNV